MKVIVLGSGPDRIGKTGELDRLARHGLDVLKRQGMEVVYVDNNPLTSASDRGVADRVYLEPLTLGFLERIIEAERPDGILYGFGGALAAHLVTFLEREGILDRYGVRVLGTPVSSLKRILDEEILNKTLADLKIPTVTAGVARTSDECISTGRAIGFPIIMRPSFALEGMGGYRVYNIEEVKELAPLILNLSPVREIILERVTEDWIQLVVECLHDPGSPGEVSVLGTFEGLEVGNGTHWGNTALMAPAPIFQQRDVRKKVEEFAGLIGGKMGICGSFHLRLGILPSSGEMIVYRVVPWLSTFSSLAALAQDLPLAEINVCLSTGTTLEKRIKRMKFDDLSGIGAGRFAMLRVPEFSGDFQRDDTTSSMMCAVGAEVFLGLTLAEALIKSISAGTPFLAQLDWEFLARQQADPKDVGDSLRIKILSKLDPREGSSRAAQSMELDPGFLPGLIETAALHHRLKTVATTSRPEKEIVEARRAGLSEERIGEWTHLNKERIASLCAQSPIQASAVALGGHDGRFHFVSYSRKRRRTKASTTRPPALVILGPGPYAVGWGSEVDQLLVQVARSMNEQGRRVVLLNSNPNAASQDIDVMDAVYLERPSRDVFRAIAEQWTIDGVIHQFCLRLPSDLETFVQALGARVLGSPLSSVRLIQDIPALWRTLQEIGIPLLPHVLSANASHALREAEKIGYPVLVRLTDQYLNPEAEIVYDVSMLRRFRERYKGRISERNPLFIEAFKEGTISATVVALCDGQVGRPLAFMEHIEEYGVHAGDCASIVPPWSLGDHQISLALESVRHIASHFRLVGYLELQLAIRGRSVYVTGVSPYPGTAQLFAEKVMARPMHGLVAGLLAGERPDLGILDKPVSPGRIHVKESVFQFSRFPHMDPILSPRMRSTSQVAGSDETFGMAYLKSQVAANPKIHRKGKVFISARDTEKEGILQVAQKLAELGFSLVSTQGTARFISERGIEVEEVHKVSEWRPNVIDLIKNDEISLVINIPAGLQSIKDEHLIRRAATEHDVPIITTISGALLIARGLEENRKRSFTISPL